MYLLPAACGHSMRHLPGPIELHKCVLVSAVNTQLGITIGLCKHYAKKVNVRHQYNEQEGKESRTI